MTGWLRAGRLMLSLGWETGPRVFLGFVGINVVTSVGPLVFALGLRPLVNGIYYHVTADAVGGGIATAAALVLIVVAPAGQRWVTPRIRERSIMVMQRRMLTLTTRAPGLAHFERADYWDRLQLLKRNFGDLLMGMANALVGPIMLLQLLITAIILAGLQPYLLLLPLVAIPAGWLNQKAEALRLSSETPAAAPRRAAQHLFTLASSPQSAKEVQIYRLQDELIARHADQTRQVQRLTETALAKYFAVGTLGWLLFAAGYLGSAIIALRAAAAGHLTPGDVALTFSLASTLIVAANRLSQTAGMLLRAVAVAGHYQWLADQVTAPEVGGGARHIPVPGRLRDGFEFREVSFAYQNAEHPALTDISLRLDAGSVVAIVGENGAGKTTLVKLLSRMYTPSSGQILMDGTDLRDFGIDEYRRHLSAGFQDFVQWELVARESAGVGDLARMPDPAAVRGALARADAGFVEDLAHGLETPLGTSWEDGTDLSGGEWQKLALARAMMREDSLLTIFDEPSSALDPQTEHALFERIAASARDGGGRGRITVLISHRFSTVLMADKIIVLSRGRVLEQGDHRTLMTNQGLYAELFGLQARAYQ